MDLWEILEIDRLLGGHPAHHEVDKPCGQGYQYFVVPK